MASTFFLLADAADPGSGSGITSFAIFAVFGLALWFLLIRPQQKRQKEQQALLERLEAGLDVVTVGGLHGTIVDVSEQWVDLQVDQDGTVLRFQRQSIASITRDDDGEGDEE